MGFTPILQSWELNQNEITKILPKAQFPNQPYGLGHENNLPRIVETVAKQGTRYRRLAEISWFKEQISKNTTYGHTGLLKYTRMDPILVHRFFPSQQKHTLQMDSMWELEAKVPSCRYRWHSSCQCCHFSSISVSVWVLLSWTEKTMTHKIKETASQITMSIWAGLSVIHAKKPNTGLPSSFSLSYSVLFYPPK